jgi:hypothetical protein
VSFLDSHIYFPRGVLTMLSLGVGLGLLAWATTAPRVRPPQTQPAEPESQLPSTA